MRRRYRKPKNEWPLGNELPKSNKVWANQVSPTGYKDFDKRIILNKHLGISMMNIPNDKVLENTMPEQRTDMLGKKFSLRYIQYINPFDHNPDEVGWTDSKESYFYIDYFTVIRWDISDDLVILINDLKHLVIVTEAKYVLSDCTAWKDEYNRVADNAHIHEIPIQDLSFLGINTMDTYIDSLGEYHLGTIIRADKAGGQQQKCVILEDRGDSYRVVTIDEGFFFIQHADIEINSTTTVKEIYEKFWPTDWRNLK